MSEREQPGACERCVCPDVAPCSCCHVDPCQVDGDAFRRNPILAAFRARFVRNPSVHFFEAGWKAHGHCDCLDREIERLKSAVAWQQLSLAATTEVVNAAATFCAARVYDPTFPELHQRLVAALAKLDNLSVQDVEALTRG